MDNLILNRIDESFDKFTPFTFLSTVTGFGRAVYGLVELITGLAYAIIFGVRQLYNEEKAYEEKFDSGCLHIFFGAANIVKGVTEAIPLVNLLVFWYNEVGQPLQRTYKKVNG